MKEFTPSYPVPLVEQITEFLTNAIIEGRFESGQQLVENELQRKFGVSRAPIREAFRILEKKGLVSSIPRKGAFVRRINQKDIIENLTIRTSLEGLAARLAADHFSREDAEEMESIVLKMKNAAIERDFNSYLKYNSKFHNTFINASGNQTLVKILEDLRIQTIWYRFMYEYVKENIEYGIRVHREILDFFIKKAGDQAEALVKEHIMFVLKWYIRSLEAKDERVA